MKSLIHFIFPSEPYIKKQIDSQYEEEASFVQKNGFNYTLVDIEALADGNVALNSKHADLNNPEVLFIYRGWMLTEAQYDCLAKFFSTVSAKLITSTSDYLMSHYLPGWYEDIEKYTIPTIITDENNFIDVIKKRGVNEAFVKDYVKSVSLNNSSICKTPNEIIQAVETLKKHRGFIEGGICLRQIISLKPDTEERYFVYNGKAFARAGMPVPEIVHTVAALHKAPFFSVDVAEKENGELVVIEIGDGQVSDVKKWNEKGWENNSFYNIFKTSN